MLSPNLRVVVGDTVPAPSLTWDAAAVPCALADLDGEALPVHLTFYTAQEK